MALKEEDKEKYYTHKFVCEWHEGKYHRILNIHEIDEENGTKICRDCHKRLDKEEGFESYSACIKYYKEQLKYYADRKEYPKFKENIIEFKNLLKRLRERQRSERMQR